jgi:hypothetical protein
MARCYICEREIEDRSLFSHFSFGAHVGKKNIHLRCQWVDDENKEIPICQHCSATTLETFARSFIESLSGESHPIM